MNDFISRPSVRHQRSVTRHEEFSSILHDTSSVSRSRPKVSGFPPSSRAFPQLRRAPFPRQYYDTHAPLYGTSSNPERGVGIDPHRSDGYLGSLLTGNSLAVREQQIELRQLYQTYDQPPASRTFPEERLALVDRTARKDVPTLRTNVVCFSMGSAVPYRSQIDARLNAGTYPRHQVAAGVPSDRISGFLVFLYWCWQRSH